MTLQQILSKPLTKILLVMLAGCVAWQIPSPEGLAPQAWHLFLIFVLTIVAVILRPLPMGVLSLLAMAASCLTHTLTIEQCLAAYGKPIVWLVVFAFFIAKGLRATGLGARLAYFFVGLFGRSTLGLSYGFALTDLILAPAIPSNTARGAGIIFPILKSLTDEFEGSTTKAPDTYKIGSYLIKVAFHANVITSAMFLTALAGNPLAAAIAMSQGVNLTWGTWALGASIPGLISLLGMPLIVYFFYPPKVKTIPNARRIAKEKLAEMGPLNIPQLIMGGTFIGLLLLWMLGHMIGINPTVAALLAIGTLLLTGVLQWDDLLKEKSAWGTFFWFGALIMLAGQLEDSGFLAWFSGVFSSQMSGFNWLTAIACITLIYFYAHYLFASTTALITAIYAIFLQILLTSSAPGFASAMLLAAFGCLSSCLTNYGTGSAPVYYGANYISMKKWWGIGAILGVFYILVWWTIAPLWWHLVGLM